MVYNLVGILEFGRSESILIPQPLLLYFPMLLPFTINTLFLLCIFKNYVVVNKRLISPTFTANPNVDYYAN
ncbi:hypothetical protein LINGRAHAP2_LOCUS33119 [Linum grandiflorum]